VVGGELEGVKLIARLGRDWRYVGRNWPICCAVCGSRLMITIAGDQRGPIERFRD
jgi:hypothetical protein